VLLANSFRHMSSPPGEPVPSKLFDRRLSVFDLPRLGDGDECGVIRVDKDL
jgi:hypothetical protein